jgi:hypothetical protein
MDLKTECVRSECKRIGIEIGHEPPPNDQAVDSYWIGIHIGHFFYSITWWFEWHKPVTR